MNHGTVVEVQNLIEPLWCEWEQLAEQIEARPFLWSEWIHAWWDVFGTGQLQILSVYENGLLTGVLPLHRFGEVMRSTTNSHTPLFGFLAANEMAAKQLAYTLLSQGARRIDLSFLPPTDAVVLQTRTAAKEAGYQTLTESVSVAPYVALYQTTWDAYEKGSPGKILRHLMLARTFSEGLYLRFSRP
jgi:CelD/BcsL family acetyltransferase involved in cellulose biosynthesis